jgi:hypothetical protein
MTDTPSIETTFVVVPAGAHLAGPTLRLKAVVVVEWRVPKGQSSPEWMSQWASNAPKIEVVLENDSGTSFHAYAESPGTIKYDAMSGRAGDHAREPIVSQTTVVPIGASVNQWSAASASAAIGSTAVTPVGLLAAQAFITSFSNSPSAPAAVPVIPSDFITSRIATRYPTVAQKLGLLWEVLFEIREWHKFVDQTLWLQCIPSFDKSAVSLPYTQCVIRTTGSDVFWWPALNGSSQNLVEQKYEGLIRVLPSANDHPRWFLESAEHMAAALHQASANASGDNRITKSLNETGGLAIACEGIDKIARTVGPPTSRKNQPVLSWGELFCGYRIDMWTSASGWRSLVGRTISTQEGSLIDEGMIEIGSTVVQDQSVAWRFEEVARWNGASLISSAEEKIAELKIAVVGRTDPLAQLRWNQTYSLGMRPVFKGACSMDLDQAGRLRQASPLLGFESTPYVFLREEKLGAPEVVGLTSTTQLHEVLCSLDGHGIDKTKRLEVWPPRVSAFLIKRSGVLDGSQLPGEQASLLRRAAKKYPQIKEDRFPDPSARAVEIVISPVGTPCRNCASVDHNGSTELVPGISKILQAQWNASSEWLDFEPITLMISASHESKATQAGRTIHIALAPGKQVNILLRCALHPEKAPQHFAHARRMLSFLSLGKSPGAVDIPAIPISALSDEVSIQVRHITEKSLEPPEMTSPAIHRQLGQSEAMLIDLIRGDRMTTGEILAELEWEDWENGSSAMQMVSKTLQTPPTIVDSEQSEDYGTAGELTTFIPSSLRIPFPDTRRRDITVQLLARSRDGERFKDGGEVVKGTSRQLIVPNSKRPSAPRVSIALPVISTTNERLAHLTKTRTWRQDTRGDRIRIYLGSKWFETGNEELLGVVCAPESQISISDENRRGMKAYVTQWGAEILVATPSIGPGPFARNLSLKTLTFDGMLSTTGIANDQPVAAVVAGHKVSFDEASREYFADIALSGHGSPYAWIRLALARLQPESVDGAHLSQTVIAQYSQLLPDRWVTVSEVTGNPRIMNVAAARTPVEAVQGNSEISAFVTTHVPAEVGDGRDGQLELHAGRLWRLISEAQLEASVGTAQGSYWLGEISIPANKTVLVGCREHWQSSRSISLDKGVLRWEARVVIER